MKSFKTILAAVALAACFTAPVMAQNLTHGFVTADNNMRSSKMIGMTVYNEKGERIGKLDDIMVSSETGEVTAVISVGSFIGGTKSIKVPLSHVKFDAGKPMMGNGSKAAIMAMPAYHYYGITKSR